MNKVELVSKVVERLAEKETKVTKKAMAVYVDEVFDTIASSLVDGEEVKVSGFGTFSVVERAERQGRNPATGESLTIEASKAPKFKASNVLKNSVKATA